MADSDKANEEDIGADVVGAPVKIIYRHQCQKCQMIWDDYVQEANCRQCGSIMISVADIKDG